MHKRVLHCLNLGGSLESLLLLQGAHLGLGAHDTTTPLSAGLLVLVHEAILDGGDELGQLSLVLGADLSEGEDSGGLLVDDGAETGLALDNGVGDTHLLAERGEEDDELDGVDVVGDEDEGSLLVLNQANNVVETVLDGVGLLGDILLLLALLDGGGLLEETLLLLGLGLGAVLVQELEGLSSGVLVEDVGELGDSRGDLDAHLKDLLLALEADILGPLNHAREVTLGLDVLADTVVTGATLDERVLNQRKTLLAGRQAAESGLIRQHVPWEPSWSQPYPEGKGRRRPSCQSWGAVIEKRRHQHCALNQAGLL